MTSTPAAPDPRGQEPAPDTAQQGRIPHPGLTDQMRDRPDHGETSYVGSGRLDGMRTVVTGGDSGIGRAVAIAFAREGADVMVVHLPEEEQDADETCDLVTAAGRKAVHLAADLTDEDACRAVVDTAVDQLGGIDVLVNNAAHQMAQTDGIEGITTEQFDRTMRTNVYAMFWLSKLALPHLRPGSSILNTASIQGSSPSPQLIDYAMTKAAIISFTQSTAQLLADRGVRVNAVAPGPIWTPLIPSTMPDEKVGSFGADTPMGRPGQPAEVAPAYVYLASAQASYVTGAVIPVTGGEPF
jgi:NAD(P)-dependent dehydrogenase (short-subunit alcohol dehydrogenase family)